MKRRMTAGILAGALALSLSACSNGTGDGADASASASASASESATAQGTESPEVAVSDEGMPSVKDGDTPAFDWSKAGKEAPEGIQVAILEEGDGPEVSSTDMVTVNYVGAVWGSDEAFDSSYEHGGETTFPLGNLVTGWAYGLEGRHVGDKVILSIPPEYGYEEAGQPSAGIGGEDTIVFYIELLDAVGTDASGDADAAMEVDLSSLPVDIEGELGSPVTSLSVKEGAEEPAETKMTVIARGKGKEIGEESYFYYQVFQGTWDNSQQLATWTVGDSKGQGPQMGQAGQQSVLDKLVGVPEGSRVLFEIAGTSDDASEAPATAAVVDIVKVE